jgi:hypothetical protein
MAERQTFPVQTNNTRKTGPSLRIPERPTGAAGAEFPTGNLLDRMSGVPRGADGKIVAQPVVFVSHVLSRDGRLPGRSRALSWCARRYVDRSRTVLGGVISVHVRGSISTSGRTGRTGVFLT